MHSCDQKPCVWIHWIKNPKEIQTSAPDSCFKVIVCCTTILPWKWAYKEIIKSPRLPDPPHLAWKAHDVKERVPVRRFIQQRLDQQVFHWPQNSSHVLRAFQDKRDVASLLSQEQWYQCSLTCHHLSRCHSNTVVMGRNQTVFFYFLPFL